MAIFDHIEVVLVVDGQPLPEFDIHAEEDEATQHNGAPRIVKYIQAMSNQEFGIRVTFKGKVITQSGDDFALDIAFDGKSCASSVLDRTTFSTGRRSHTETSIKVGKVGEWYKKKFKFANLVTSES